MRTTNNTTSRLGANAAGTAAVIAAWALAFLALVITAGGAFAQAPPLETTEPTTLEETNAPDANGEDPAPPGGERGGKKKDRDEGGLEMAGISITDGCTEVGPIRIGNCGDGAEKPDGKAQPPTEDPAPTSPPVGTMAPEAPPETTSGPNGDPETTECDTTTQQNTATPPSVAVASAKDEEAAPESGSTQPEETTAPETTAPETLTPEGATDPTETTPEECGQTLQDNTQVVPQDSGGQPEAEEPPAAPQEVTAPLPEETAAPEPTSPETTAPIAPEGTTEISPEGAEEPTPEEDQYTAPEDSPTEAEEPVSPQDVAEPEAIEPTGPTTAEITAPAEDVCPGAREIEASSGGVGNQYTDPFEIEGGKFVLAYKATTADPADEGGNLIVDVTSADNGMTMETIRAQEEGANSTPLELGPGSYALNVYADNRDWETKAYDCTEAPVAPEDEGAEEPAPETASEPEPAPETTSEPAPAAEPEPQEATAPEAPEPAEPEAAEEPSATEGEGFGLGPEEKAAEAFPPPQAMTPTEVRMTSTKAKMPTMQTDNGPVAVLPETGGPAVPASTVWMLAAVSCGSVLLLGFAHAKRRRPLETDQPAPSGRAGRRS